MLNTNFSYDSRRLTASYLDEIEGYFTCRFFCKGHDKGRVSSESYKAFLTEVLSTTRKHTVIIQDGASYHTGRIMKKFFTKKAPRITFDDLPFYSAVYNPIEKLWKKKQRKRMSPSLFSNF